MTVMHVSRGDCTVSAPPKYANDNVCRPMSRIAQINKHTYKHKDTRSYMYILRSLRRYVCMCVNVVAHILEIAHVMHLRFVLNNAYNCMHVYVVIAFKQLGRTQLEATITSHLPITAHNTLLRFAHLLNKAK